MTQGQQQSFVQEITNLATNNQNEAIILTSASKLALTMFGVLSCIDGDDFSVGFNLQDYVANVQDVLNGTPGAAEWAERSFNVLKSSVAEKFGAESAELLDNYIAPPSFA